MTPQPPYYAVIFSSQRSPEDPEGYAVMAKRMVELAKEQPGFLGYESSRDEKGFGITVSYWSSIEAIERWKRDPEHQKALTRGKNVWYSTYHLRVSQVLGHRGRP